MCDGGCARTYISKQPADAVSISVKVLHCLQHSEEIGKPRHTSVFMVCLFAGSKRPNSGKKNAEREKVSGIFTEREKKNNV